LLVLKKGIKVVKEKKTYLSTFFIDLEGRVSRLICCVFFISFEKGFKMKSQVAK